MYLFQDINKMAKSQIFSNEREAREWYRRMAMDIGKVDRTKIMDTAGAFKIFQKIEGPAVGKMFMFVYDAKHKATLPFWDAFPLIFPIDFYHDGFLGLNLHYLPPMARARLMDALYTTSTNQNFDKSTKLNISYKILRESAIRFSGFQECVHRYLYDHVKSSFHYVNPADWDKALMLPMQRWVVNPIHKYSSKSQVPY